MSRGPRACALVAWLAVGLLATPTAQATLVSSQTLDNVSIGGSLYDVTFTQDSSGLTLPGDLYGSFPLTFTTAQSAQDAAIAILAAVVASGFDVTPANDFNVFYVPYELASTSVAGIAFGNVDNGRVGLRQTTGGYGSFASFQAAQSVPEPGTPGLLGLGLAVLGFASRRPGMAACSRRGRDVAQQPRKGALPPHVSWGIAEMLGHAPDFLQSGATPAVLCEKPRRAPLVTGRHSADS